MDRLRRPTAGCPAQPGGGRQPERAGGTGAIPASRRRHSADACRPVPRSGCQRRRNTIPQQGQADDQSHAGPVSKLGARPLGGIARSVEAGEASTAASLATLASARLSAEASLAQNYFLLRVADASANLQRATVQAYQRALQITENQLKAGIVTRADVAQAKTQLHNAEVTLTDLAVSRAQYEHAIAILIGKAPADFSLAPATLPETLPSVPALLPADLLERRPDVAAAERKMAAANAQIGVARAAWFPSLKLTAGSSLQNTDLTEWLNAPSRVWSLGATLAETLFDGGQRTAKDRQTHAAYDITVAQYRQTVLGALQEVEDNLVALRVLADEARQQATALAAAREAERLMLNRYKAGTVSYTSVVSTQATANSSERNALQILARRYTASVLLIKALGGGWQGLTQESPPLAFRQPREKPMPAPDGHPS
ncbi:MAG: hypothetical protein BSR46_01045 [Candidatus Dactylopiibacterium carminicum]|nr:MAG: hypothetical protein BSR46_01045 [Candidatus Dactylopiibacterium carminicum]